MIEYEFHGRVLRVEERFQTRYDRKKLGEAKSETQVSNAGEQVSLGWFVVLEEFGAAISFGKLKPDIEKDDVLIASFSKKPREPKPATVEAPKPKPDPAAARAAFLETLSPEQRDRVLEVLQ